MLRHVSEQCAAASACRALVASLTRVAHDLDPIGARWALIGGFAVAARADSACAEPRFTRDVDACVLVEDDNAAVATALLA